MLLLMCTIPNNSTSIIRRTIYPHYPFARHQDYWPSTCHGLVRQTSTESRTAAAIMLAVQDEYGNKTPKASTFLVDMGHTGLASALFPLYQQRSTWLSIHLLDRAPLKQDPRAQHGIRISTVVHFQRQLHLRVLWSRSIELHTDGSSRKCGEYYCTPPEAVE